MRSAACGALSWCARRGLWCGAVHSPSLQAMDAADLVTHGNPIQRLPMVSPRLPLSVFVCVVLVCTRVLSQGSMATRWNVMDVGSLLGLLGLFGV